MSILKALPTKNPPEWLKGLETELRELVEATPKEFGDLSLEQLNWKPQPNKWSIGQLIQHLNQSTEPYLHKVESALGKTAQVGTVVPHRHSFFGKMILKAVLGQKNVATLKIFNPQDVKYKADEVLQDFVRIHTEMADLTDKAVGQNLKIKVSSPGSRFIKMNLGDAVAIQTYHVKRHLAQARERMQMPNFPTA